MAALALLGLAVPLWLGARASLPPAVYFEHDQRHYLAAAAGDTRSVDAPFAWRVLPPALVRASRLPPARGFRTLTLLALMLVPPVIALMLSAAGISTATAFVLGALSAFAPPVAGYLSWDYIRPDGVSLLLIAVTAWSAIRQRPCAFAIAMAALALTKETWVIAAAFALLWSRAVAPEFRRAAAAGTLIAFVTAVAVRIVTSTPQPYSIFANVRELYWPFDARTIARRLLLATASTWTVLLPVAAFALVRRIREPRAWAASAALAIATAQILVAIDTQRIVAAGLPFLLLACAWELDGLATPSRRMAAGAVLAALQLPWLLAYARVWAPPLRGVEVGLVCVSLAAAACGWRARRVSAT